MIDTKAMKSKILDLALRGQLTERLPEDGTAEQLYQQICAEKEDLIRTGIIKKEKPVPEITAKEIPFDIPKNWKWVRLGAIAHQITDGTHRTPTYQKEGIPFLSVKNISSGYMDLSDIKYIPISEHNELIKRCKPEINDVLICRIGTLGRALRIDTDIAFSIFVSLGLIKTGNETLSNHIVSVINSGYGSEWIQSIKAGGAMHAYKINLTDLNLLPIPLAPLAEQQRIYERITQAFSTLESIDTLQAQYADNLTALKSKLIDAAIQGKLTKHLPEDNTAEELYQQVQAERKHQEEAGTIKSVELAPDVTEAHQPFAIPANWKWTHLGNVSYIVRGGSPRPIKQYITNREDGINWIKIGDVEKGGKYIYSTHEKIIPEGESKSRRVYPGDFLLTNSMSFGRPYISKIEGCIHDGWLLIHDLKGFDPDYLYYLLSSSYLYGQFTVKASGSTVDNLNIDKVSSAIIPLPPLAEQKRIAQKIDELLPIISAGGQK